MKQEQDPGTVLDSSPSEFDDLAAGPEKPEEMPENAVPNEKAVEMQADDVDSKSEQEKSVTVRGINPYTGQAIMKTGATEEEALRAINQEINEYRDAM